MKGMSIKNEELNYKLRKFRTFLLKIVFLDKSEAKCACGIIMNDYDSK
jgi:hypothetical protein